MKHHFEYRTIARRLLSYALAASLVLPLPSPAAPGDPVALATAPLASSTTSKVRPNVMFILDDSGSMDWDYLPDWANDNDPVTGTSYTNIPALHRNGGFNGVAYNPATTYSPPVLYNADGTQNTTTYPNIGSPWTSVKNDAYGVQSTSSTNLVTSFPDVEWCTDTSYSNCLRNDNYILPGTVGGVAYTKSHSKASTGSGQVATGSPSAATAAPATGLRSFGPFYYTIIPGEYCDSPNLKNCQTTQTATFIYPASLRWCDSAAATLTPTATTCQALNSSTYKYPRFPTRFFTPGVPAQPAMPEVLEVQEVIGVKAGATFNFTYGDSRSPSGFSVKVNGTEILSTAGKTPGWQTASGMAGWVAGHNISSTYGVTSIGNAVTITANATGTASNISTVVISENALATVSATSNPTFVSGVTETGTAPANGTLVITAVAKSQTVSFQCGSGGTSYFGQPGTFTSSSSGTASTRLNSLYNTINGTTINGYTTSCTKSPNTSSPTSLSCAISAPVGVSACSGGFTVDSDITKTTNTGPSGGTPATGTKAAGTLTFTYSGSLNPTELSIKVSGAALASATEIMTATTPGSAMSSSALASWVASNSSLSGYTITSGGSTVTITANTAGPDWNLSAIQNTQNPVTADTPVLVAGVNAVAYQAYQAAIPAQPAQDPVYYGNIIRTDVVSGTDSYPYPGTSTKASTRTDCIADTTDPKTCTYAEEMTNFANWWTYYHTRMQAMKTSVSRAFKTLDNRFRVGFTTISNTGASNGATFLGNDTFELAHKNTWFTKLFATTTPSYTPLRGALSKAGRYYAKKVSGQTVDPVQYSCQQNFTILSTDGYWNTNAETASYKALDLAGVAVGNLDGGTTARPMKEGTTAVSDTLADIAKYYYETDLRTGTLGNCAGGSSPDFTSGNPDVCTNNVFHSSTDDNIKQHMTTFTMGLGADGTLNYTSDYTDATSGDYYDLKNGLGTPPMNWPNPIANTGPERIDDLWHAAVNGRGVYFSAKSPDQIITGFNKALSAITAKLGSAAAAATSTLNPVAGNNYAYVASYTTVKWTGNLESRSINTTTGVVSETATWCVEDVVAPTCVAPGSVVADTSGSGTVYNCVVSGATSGTCTAPGVFDSGTSECRTEIAHACTGTMPAKVGKTTDTRTIYTAPAGALVPLTAQNLVLFDEAYATENPTNFSSTHITGLNGLAGADLTNAAGKNLINYLRGQNGFEDRTSNAAGDRLYRAREAVLGDALESQPAFISKPVFSYPYAGYSTYKTDQAGRPGAVYMGTNDGMMHAFAALDGKETWAYVPSMVIPNMWKLASTSYKDNHANFVNGSPITSDIYCPQNCGGLTDGTASASWRTVLVAGLNGGGRGYFALDITVPATPVLLWEFTPAADSDLGYSYGQPIITKLADTDGTWVVLVTSGYDNGTKSGDATTDNSPAGNGTGYLYVLNANTGAIISKISTAVGTPTAPSGLAKIAAWNDVPAGNQAGYVYGGDLLGNVWRFDINSTATAAIGAGDVFKFATLFSDAGGTAAQPITTTPVLGKILEKRVVFIGTGKYLESADIASTSTQTQTQYAIKDDDATATLVNPRATLVHTSLSANPDGTATRVTTGTGANFLVDRGWWADFPDSMERANIDSKLIQGTLLVPTIVPSNTVCSPGGYGWLNFFDYETGLAITTAPGSLASAKYDSTIVGVNVIYIGGEPKVEVVTSTNPTPELDPKVAFKATVAGFTGKRVIWRELVP